MTLPEPNRGDIVELDLLHGPTVVVGVKTGEGRKFTGQWMKSIPQLVGSQGQHAEFGIEEVVWCFCGVCENPMFVNTEKDIWECLFCD